MRTRNTLVTDWNALYRRTHVRCCVLSETAVRLIAHYVVCWRFRACVFCASVFVRKCILEFDACRSNADDGRTPKHIDRLPGRLIDLPGRWSAPPPSSERRAIDRYHSDNTRSDENQLLWQTIYESIGCRHRPSNDIEIERQQTLEQYFRTSVANTFTCNTSE